MRFNPHDYGTIQEIADEITNIQGIQHESLVKYFGVELHKVCLLYTSPSPRDKRQSRMPSSA